MKFKENSAVQIFPILQIGSFVACLYFLERNLLLAIIFLLLSVILLNFTLHITVHRYVHHQSKNKIINGLMELVYSIVIAMPFTNYRMLHYNHHRYDNSIEDLTSTWTLKNGKPNPKSFFNYSFLWIFGASFKKAKRQLLADGDTLESDFIKSRSQILILILLYTFLFSVNEYFAVAYFALFYLGWILISATNYGQHLPIEYGKPEAYTYDNPLFNHLFFNHGLHLEHHLKPSRNYNELKSENRAQITQSYLFIGLLKKKKWTKS